METGLCGRPGHQIKYILPKYGVRSTTEYSSSSSSRVARPGPSLQSLVPVRLCLCLVATERNQDGLARWLAVLDRGTAPALTESIGKYTAHSNRGTTSEREELEELTMSTASRSSSIDTNSTRSHSNNNSINSVIHCVGLLCLSCGSPPPSRSAWARRSSSSSFLLLFLPLLLLFFSSSSHSLSFFSSCHLFSSSSSSYSSSALFSLCHSLAVCCSLFLPSPFSLLPSLGHHGRWAVRTTNCSDILIF